MDKDHPCKIEVVHIGPGTPGGMDSVIRFLLKHNAPSTFVSTRSFGKKYFLRNIIIYMRAIFSTFLMARKRRYIFHIHATKNGSLLRKAFIGLMLHFTNNVYIAHMHAGTLGWFNSNILFFRRILFFFLSSARYVIVLSDSWKNYYLGRFPELNNIRVIPNPCNSAVSECPQISQKETIKFLYAGVISPAKGIYDLVDAFLGVDSKVHTELHIFGSGEVEKLRNYANKSKKGKRIFIHEWLPHKTYLSLINDFDVFVLPSYAEGMPMSILEAMGHALPIIASDVGGNSALVINGVNGFLIKPGDIASLTEKMQSISSDFMLRSEMSISSWKLARPFSPKEICDKWNDLYSDVIDSTILSRAVEI